MITPLINRPDFDDSYNRGPTPGLFEPGPDEQGLTGRATLLPDALLEEWYARLAWCFDSHLPLERREVGDDAADH